MVEDEEGALGQNDVVSVFIIDVVVEEEEALISTLDLQPVVAGE